MKNKLTLFIIVIFLSFCFVVFYKGLNTSNNYTNQKLMTKEISQPLKLKTLIQIAL